ncbi:IclR family transcriptional regulator domain-containing protein [Ignatzschineria sp. LJL83]
MTLDKDSNLQLVEHYSSDPDFISAFARGLVILQILSISKKPQTISDISKITGFPRASVRRSLYTLLKMGFVHQDDRYYELTSKVLTLAHSYITSQTLPNAAQPILEGITRNLDEASSMAVLVQNEIIYIARSSENTQRIMTNTLTIGSHLPAYCTSMGRILLAAEPTEKQIEILKESQLKAHTQNTINEIDALLEELAKIKEQGYAIINQELELGLCSIAVPVRDKSGKTIAAINVSTHAMRNEIKEMKERFLPELLASSAILTTFI